MQRLARAVPDRAARDRVRRAASSRRPTPTSRGRPGSSATTSATAARRAAPRRSCSAGKILRPARRPLQRLDRRHPRRRPARRCATASSSTSRARPRASRPRPSSAPILDAVVAARPSSSAVAARDRAMTASPTPPADRRRRRPPAGPARRHASRRSCPSEVDPTVFDEALPAPARAPAAADAVAGPRRAQGRPAERQARPVGRVRRLPRLHPRRRPAPARLERLRPAREAVREAVRRGGGRHDHAPHRRLARRWRSGSPRSCCSPSGRRRRSATSGSRARTGSRSAR